MLIMALVISFFLLPICFNFCIKFSTIKYNLGSYDSSIKYYWFWYIIYICISYKYNLETLKFIKKENFMNLVIQTLIDIFLIPLNIFLLIIYYNHNSSTGLEEVASLNNVLLILFTLILKHFIISSFGWWLRKKVKL
jgi:hypothetical protein